MKLSRVAAGGAAVGWAARAWWRRKSGGWGPICDVCFKTVEPGAEMCPHCGTVFGDPDREPHAAEPRVWVAAQVARLRAMTYEELLALRDSPRHFDVPVDDGSLVFQGEFDVFWDGDHERDLRVVVAIWNDRGGSAVASDGFIRAPDGSFVGE